MKLSDQIRRQVESMKGMSRNELCTRIGLDPAQLSRFMAGREGLALPTVDRLADVLGFKIVSRRKSKGR